jgi:hypothetical protein
VNETKFKLGQVVWSEKYNTFGQIWPINPYKDGTPYYKENNHYKVWIKKKSTFITHFEIDLLNKYELLNYNVLSN